jgi:hypothetical protein
MKTMFRLGISTLVAGLSVGLASPAKAQLLVSGSCWTGAPDCTVFEAVLKSSGRPYALRTFEVTLLTPGFSFRSSLWYGSDQFGSLGGSGAAIDGARYSIHFLDSPGYPVEFVAPFYARIRTDVDGPAGVAPSFDWMATEIDGTVASGTFSNAHTLPEPGSLALLLAGLLGLGLRQWSPRRQSLWPPSDSGTVVR